MDPFISFNTVNVYTVNCAPTREVSGCLGIRDVEILFSSVSVWRFPEAADTKEGSREKQARFLPLTKV